MTEVRNALYVGVTLLQWGRACEDADSLPDSADLRVLFNVASMGPRL